MKRVLKLLLVLSSLFVLVVVGAVVYLANLNLNDHKGWITAAFADVAGRELQLRGELRHGIDYPWLELELNGVVVGNVAGFDGDFLSGEHFKVRLNLLPLLDRHLELDAVELKGVRLNLVRNQQGIGNWQVPPADAEPGAAGRAGDARRYTVSFREVKVEDTALGWRDEVSGKTVRLDNMQMLCRAQPPQPEIAVQATATLSATRPPLTGDIRMSGRLTPEKRGGTLPFTLEALLKSPLIPAGQELVALDSTLTWQGGDVQLSELRVQALGSVVTGRLRLQDADTAPSIAAALNVQGQDIALPFKVAGVEPLASQLAKQKQRRYTANVALDADLGKGALSLETLEMSLLGADLKARVAATGMLGGTPVLRGMVRAQGPDLPLLMAVAGAYLPANNPLSANVAKLAKLKNKDFQLSTRFDVDLNEQRVELPELQVRALGLELNGHVSSAERLRGRLEFAGDALRPLLAALGQQTMAGVLQKLTCSATLAGTLQNIRIEPLSLRATLDGSRVPSSPVVLAVDASGTLDTHQQQLTVDTFTASGLGLKLSGALTLRDYRQQAAYEGTLAAAPVELRKLLKQLDYPVPEGIDDRTLRRVALDEFAFSGDANGLNIPNLRMVLDDSKLAGKLAVKDFSAPRYELDLAVDAIDLDRYLPEKQQGGPTASRAATGKGGEIQVGKLKGLQFAGELRVGKLTLRNAQFRSLLAKVRAENGLLQLDPLEAQVYDGGYQGRVSLDVRGAVPELKVYSAAHNVQIGALLRDVLDTEEPHVTGNGNIELQLGSVGGNTEALLANLAGAGALEMRAGVFKGIDIAEVLYQIEQLIESKRLGSVELGEETRFEEMSATLNIDSGIVNNDDLLLRAPGFRATGVGTLLNLIDATWQYTFSIATEERRTKQGGKTYNLGGHSLVVHCSGKLSDKRCRPDVEALLTRALGNALLGAAAEKLGEKLGGRVKDLLLGTDDDAPDVGQQPPAAAGGAAAEEAPREGAAKEKDVGEQRVDELLDKLF